MPIKGYFTHAIKKIGPIEGNFRPDIGNPLKFHLLWVVSHCVEF